jgi:hypothetical protein
MHLCFERGEEGQPVATTLTGPYSNLSPCSQEILLELLRVTEEKEIVSITDMLIWLSSCFIGLGLFKTAEISLTNLVLKVLLCAFAEHNCQWNSCIYFSLTIK